MALGARLALLARIFHFTSSLGTRSTSLLVHLVMSHTLPRSAYSVAKDTPIINTPRVRGRALRRCCINTDTPLTEESLFQLECSHPNYRYT